MRLSYPQLHRHRQRVLHLSQRPDEVARLKEQVENWIHDRVAARSCPGKIEAGATLLSFLELLLDEQLTLNDP